VRARESWLFLPDGTTVVGFQDDGGGRQKWRTPADFSQPVLTGLKLPHLDAVFLEAQERGDLVENAVGLRERPLKEKDRLLAADGMPLEAMGDLSEPAGVGDVVGEEDVHGGRPEVALQRLAAHRTDSWDADER